MFLLFTRSQYIESDEIIHSKRYMVIITVAGQNIPDYMDEI